MRDWVHDLGLGIRLAVSGRRSGWSRLVLAAAGTAIGVAVLLLAASIPHAVDRNQARSDARLLQYEKQPGVDVLLLHENYDEFRGRTISTTYVQATGPRSPVPPGLSRLPRPGEIALSPALARLMSTSDGQLLAPRFPGRRIAPIADAGLDGPSDLRAYVAVTHAGAQAQHAYGFGEISQRAPLPPVLAVLLVVGVSVLLFPVLVFVLSTTRLSGGDRDRRLSALRLLGANAAQTRRIATAEMLLGSIGGLVLGTGLFLAVRPLADRVTVADHSLFAADLVPSPWSMALIAVAIPAVTTYAALVAQRRTVVEPLGVIRQAARPRRRFWWRLLPGVGGAVALLYAARGPVQTNTLVVGVVGLLASVPLLLPWFVERGVLHWPVRSVAGQLGAGRLRLDSGTPARVVAGVAVALAGAVALFSLLAVDGARYGGQDRLGEPSVFSVQMIDGAPPVAALRKVPGALSVVPLRESYADNLPATPAVMTCSGVAVLVPGVPCRDGDAFVARSDDGVRIPGSRVALRPVDLPPWFPDPVLLTPGAVPPSIQHNLGSPAAFVHYRPRAGATQELLRNALAPLQWRASGYVRSGPDYDAVSVDTGTYRNIRAGLYAGALLVLVMAMATMLVVGVEQVRERRRPLAALAASGVPRSTLTRSVLWQNAVPLVAAVGVADAIGVVLALLLARIAHQPMTVDWAGMGWLTAAAVATVAVATACTLPAIRRATRPTMLRAE